MTSWRHHYDIIRSRDVIGHVMTILLSMDDFLNVHIRNQTRISLSFR